jgi:putative sugar O-methyltransferase
VRVIALRTKLQNGTLTNPPLLIEDKEIVQDDLNSLFEFEQIEKLLSNIQLRKNKILEIGAGSGRTAKVILSIMNNIKYIIADIPPAINLCINSLKKYFPDKNLATAF